MLSYITCPLLLPTAFLTGILSLVNAFKVFREAWMIPGNYPHDSIYMLQNLFNNWFLKLDMQKMTAAAVMLAVVLGCIFIGSQKIEGEMGAGNVRRKKAVIWISFPPCLFWL